MGLCSVITVLESGAAVVSGPPDIVRTDKRVLDAYLGADLDEDTGPGEDAGLDDPGPEAETGASAEEGR
jgi:hypothetical protein